MHDAGEVEFNLFSDRDNWYYSQFGIDWESWCAYCHPKPSDATVERVAADDAGVTMVAWRGIVGEEGDAFVLALAQALVGNTHVRVIVLAGRSPADPAIKLADASAKALCDAVPRSADKKLKLQKTEIRSESLSELNKKTRVPSRVAM
eukprot:SAG31_NODE_12930_length_905_cov_15.378412_1_plen_148_part_00